MSQNAGTVRRRKGFHPIADVRAAFASSYDSRRPVEEQLRQVYRDVVKTMGGRSWHTHDSRRSDTGWPDEATVIGDRLIFVELKAPGGTLSDTQRECHQLLTRAGQLVFVITSTGDRGRDQLAIAEFLGKQRR